MVDRKSSKLERGTAVSPIGIALEVSRIDLSSPLHPVQARVIRKTVIIRLARSGLPQPDMHFGGSIFGFEPFLGVRPEPFGKGTPLSKRFFQRCTVVPFGQ